MRLVVADGHSGVPLPVHSSKRRLRLAEKLADDGRLPSEAVEQLVETINGLRQEATRWGVAQPLAVATAAVRNAANQQHILAEVRARTGLCVNVISGNLEAELTFLAACDWVGLQAGSMVLLDIGGGSLEMASGRGRTPDFSVSLPLRVARLTREYLDHDVVPTAEDLRRVRRRVRHELRDVTARMQWERPRTAVATSRTFHQLGRLCGATPGRQGLFGQARAAPAGQQRRPVFPADRHRLDGRLHRARDHHPDRHLPLVVAGHDVGDACGEA